MQILHSQQHLTPHSQKTLKLPAPLGLSGQCGCGSRPVGHQSSVDIDQYRAQLRALQDEILCAAQGWTLVACSPDSAEKSSAVLLFESCTLTASSIVELLQQPFPAVGPVLVLCDDRCPDGGADELMHQLRQQLGRHRCHFLVVLPEAVAQERLQRIWHSGVDALVCEESCGDGHLLRSVLLVLRGHGSVDPPLQKRLQQPSADITAGPVVMKERERELLLAVARGHSSATIAALHQVRSDSVRRSLSALYRKVGVKDQRGLIAWGLEQGLLRPPDLLPPPRATVHQASRNRHRRPAADH